MDGVPDVTQPPVKPGETFTYEFVATGPAVGMYHSHDYAEHQVPDGLAGVFLVGDEPLPAGAGPVTQQIPMVLNDAGRHRPLAERQVVPRDRAGHRARRARGSRSTTSTRVCRSTRCTCTACRSS